MGKTIGLIDDSKVMRSILRKSILMNHYQVDQFLEAENGVEGLNLLADGQGRMDVAFVDLHMPEMNGLDMLTRLREAGGGELPVPIVIVSTSADTEMQKRCMNLGASGFIRKPFTPQDIGELMTRVVGAAAPEDAAAETQPSP